WPLAATQPRSRRHGPMRPLQPRRWNFARPSRDSRVLPLAAGIQTRAALVEPRLHVDHAELAICDLAVRRHRPQETNTVARNGDVWVVTTGHQHGIAVANNGHELGILGVAVNELNSIRRIWHVEIHIH